MIALAPTARVHRETAASLIGCGIKTGKAQSEHIFSGVPSIADLAEPRSIVRVVPQAVISQRLFDHLVGAGEQGRWHVKTERLGGPEIDD